MLREASLSIATATSVPLPHTPFERSDGSFAARALGNAVHTFLEFLSLLVLYMAWVVLLLRMILADDLPVLEDEAREVRRR